MAARCPALVLDGGPVLVLVAAGPVLAALDSCL